MTCSGTGRCGPVSGRRARSSPTRPRARNASSGSSIDPGAVQTEIRIGHVGLPRRVPDFHAVSVMGAILGGLFNSRLNMQLREAKGYTYGAGAGFDMRRAAGPFTARAAVNTEVTVPAVLDTLAELERMRDTWVEADELAAARDFLVGVFPLRFETPGAVVSALAGLAIHGLPMEELVDYRTRIEAVDIEAIAAAARAHLAVDRAAIVLVGDADAFGSELEAAGLGRIVIDRDEAPHAAGPLADVDQAAAAVDESEETGPTAGAEIPTCRARPTIRPRPTSRAGRARSRRTGRPLSLTVVPRLVPPAPRPVLVPPAPRPVLVPPIPSRDRHAVVGRLVSGGRAAKGRDLDRILGLQPSGVELDPGIGRACSNRANSTVLSTDHRNTLPL